MLLIVGKRSCCLLLSITHILGAEIYNLMVDFQP